MAFFRGEEGSVKFDDAGTSASAIANTKDWNLTVTKDLINTTYIGSSFTGAASTYRKHEGGFIHATGKATLFYAATTGDETNKFIEQVNLEGDSGIALFELYLDTSSSQKITFDGVITSSTYGSKIGSLVEIEVSFTSSGTITMSI